MNQQGITFCPFHRGTYVKNSFIGRQQEIERIKLSISSSSMSINIFGDSRIGKSSLLNHLSKKINNSFRIINDQPVYSFCIYASLQESYFNTKDGFYRTISERIYNKISEQKQKHWLSFVRQKQFSPSSTIQEFEVFLKETYGSYVLPIVCLDEFETLLQDPNEFDRNFYNSLKSLVEKDLIALLIASRRPIKAYKILNRQLGSFFQKSKLIPLGRLTQDEALMIVNLPYSIDNSLPAGLIEKNKKIALRWGRRHPMLLQSACLHLWDAQQQGKSIKWAKKEFYNNYSMCSPQNQIVLKVNENISIYIFYSWAVILFRYFRLNDINPKFLLFLVAIIFGLFLGEVDIKEEDIKAIKQAIIKFFIN